MSQRRDNVTPCCGYTIRDEKPVVKWNPYNGVVQCHACGEIYVHETALSGPRIAGGGIDIWARCSIKAAIYAETPSPLYECELCGAEDANLANGATVCMKCEKEWDRGG